MEDILSIIPPSAPAYTELLQAKNAYDAAIAAGQGEIAEAKANAVRGLLSQVQQSKGNPKAVKKLEMDFKRQVADLSEFGSQYIQKKPKAAAQQHPEEALAQIENALNMGDERGIKLSDQEIKSAASFIESGDLKGASKVAGKLTQRIEEAIKLQNEEEKETRTTQDGTQFSVGKKTGTIYNGGVPVSRGMQNTDSFNLFTGSKAVSTTPFIGQIEAVLPEKTTKSVSQLETVQPQPELYSQQTRPESDTGVPKTTQYIVKARELYMNGDVQGALDILNATNLPSVYQGLLDANSLPEILGVQPQQPAPTETPQAPQPNKTSKGTRFQILPD